MVRTRGGPSGKGKEIASGPPAKGKGAKRSRDDGSQPRSSSTSIQDTLQDSLGKCAVHPTRFVDWRSVARLGISDDLDMLFTTMGIYRYMHLRETTYPEETLQFLESLRAGGGTATDTHTAIRFTIHGVSYRLSIREIREIYGFVRIPTSDDDAKVQDGMIDLWHRTVNGDYRMGKAKSSQIRNPVMRLAQRALAMTFFGRYQAGAVTVEEWRMICHALRPLVADFEPPLRLIPSIDPAVLFVGNMFRTQDLATVKKPEGWHLHIGGTWTPIFRHCGVQLSRPIDVIPLIDIDHLHTCRFLSRARHDVLSYPFTWGGRNQELILPNPAMVRLSDPDNILFAHILDDRESDEDSGGDHPDDDQPHDGQPDTARVYGAARYQHPIKGIPKTTMEKELVKQVDLLKRWVKWQGRSIQKLFDGMRKLKGRQGGSSTHASTSRQDHPESPQSSNPSLDLSTPPSTPPDSDHGSGSA